MTSVLSVIQIILAIGLIALIITQSKGGGLGSAFGGSGQLYHTRRGLDKMLFTLTIVLAALFLLASLIRMFIGR